MSLNWTRELPSETGYYWVCDATWSYEKPMIVLIGHLEDEGWTVTMMFNEESSLLSDYKNEKTVYWIGPIEIPELAVKEQFV